MIEGLFNRPSDLSQMVMPGAVLKPLRASFLLGGWVLFCVHSVTVIIAHTGKIFGQIFFLGRVIVGHFFHATAWLALRPTIFL